MSVLIPRRWPAGGVRLTVGFLDDAPADLRARIVLHMNAWAKSANVSFVETRKQAQVRIARIAGGDQGGYWSYLGTDILHIEKDQPTMNLEAFTMATSESEFKRVVRHETGHTLGFPHEHMRRQLVELIDRERAVQYFGETQGWSEDEVEQQVLTPIEDGSLLGTPRSDSNSIMCYEIPGEITKSGDPIAGGTDIDELDYEFAGSLYPK
ncbi:M12 family metallopeptidase [Mesorhizobium sp. M0292]|uniref:M12 family metallopeptidase n=1 Tax=Mesorhizobium sp. M0292 TaxID=2956929 RepID=UPI003339E046